MKQALIIVDYQNDFVDGSLGFSKAKTLESVIADRVEYALARGYDLIFTFDTHQANYLETQEGKNLPIAHCIEGTSGWAIFGCIEQYLPLAAKVFMKRAFGSLDLANYLQTQQYDTVELLGLVSNICVLSNAVLAKAALPEAVITVNASATASADEAAHAKALDIMQGLHINIIHSD
jgi:nicotinamidase-related amidase